ncbi:(2,3-dihydroxybenzoyl)adenylate synthase [Vibrio alginolyticus]|uniref:(2,3-dihydroxybenzoyl)adenylate synthase n=2 Tax=Vibrionaceae TaxID=641 RepID=UPI001482D82F|nr:MULTISPECIES: (2,3-dihydroxybenzoyl)adenylate synthase [Vibrio]EGR2324474.1 (2,3-dihydroxybenzoyl)adenylate synthase [Vibrio alginolyticus]EGX6964052.1 (2,3-dihydroxybenzoyl)adenylate synthase [Vibrio alginolyticus]EJX2556495.1 (2,3-dihydroxybenzoyl)adenylate synthase [Vibrio alginolyticus]ELA6661974.1 (2,3-dihydroxybenzoyl)adenylate synthase [Vibrio alginolyticus]ELA7570508.1 (2,3-dihydroxybenzoyl)adenylate synthase [Vibrio alginolyticus]
MTNIQHTLDFTPWPQESARYYRAKGYWQDKTLFDHLLDSVKTHPDALAIISGECSYTFQQLHDKVTQLAAGFITLGLKSGDNVVMQISNRAEFYICFFALTMQGIKPVVALPAHRTLELSYFCRHAQAKAYIFSDDTPGFDAQKTALTLQDECASLSYLIHTDQSVDSQITELSTLYEAQGIAQNSNANHVAFFQLSGGTTGTPKLIPRTHNDYAYSVIASNAICNFSEQTRYLCVLPAAHNFPLSSPGALGVFFAGGCVVLAQDSSPQNAFKLIEQHRITVSALVPPLALLWMKHAETADDDISSLKFVQVGGAKFSETTARELPNKLNCQLQQVFGMAEGLVNYTRLDDSIDVIVKTQGRPMSPDDEVLVVDDEGKPVPVGEEGALLTRGPYTIQGYFRAKEHNQRSFNAERFYATGDLVRLTSDGNIIVTGRDKDQINRGGEKIAAEEVENLILQHDSVHDVALVAIPDEFLGERSCAIIVPESNQKPKPVELKRFLHSQGLAQFKIPDQIHFAEALPKTPVGKINKKVLREQFSS